MFRNLLKSKIHRATVTDADLHYEGSVSVDLDLLEAADILPHEHVHIWDVTNGNRFETYALAAPRGSATVCINGAAAHLAKKGDIVIITSFVSLPEEKLAGHQPKVVLVDAHNQIVPEKSQGLKYFKK
ncbi:aspartate 1-decarboxylase [Deltaproteobacteria bacterium PRO3]|nr:aspartate 1-decarboxylase [Deltaproteobacteria bacterium PRO3]